MASHLPSVPLASLGEMLSPNTLCRNIKTLEEKIIEKKTVKRNRPITYSFRVPERERRINCCPESAIQYGKKTEHRGRYNINKYL